MKNYLYLPLFSNSLSRFIDVQCTPYTNRKPTRMFFSMNNLHWNNFHPLKLSKKFFVLKQNEQPRYHQAREIIYRDDSIERARFHRVREKKSGVSGRLCFNSKKLFAQFGYWLDAMTSLVRVHQNKWCFFEMRSSLRYPLFPKIPSSRHSRDASSRSKAD